MREQLLVRHFIQRFVDNDLISPRADRHHALSVAGSALIACSVVCTVFLASKYMIVSFQTPGQTAMATLVDRYFFFALSMLALALVAVGVWNAMALDERDSTILGHLPLPYAMVVRAKLKALAIFMLMFSITLNLFSSLAYPVAVANMLPVQLTGLIRLAIVQWLVSMLAGVFGFLLVMAAREVLRFLAGPRLFRRLSAVVQSLLVVSLGSLLLLLPGSASSAPRWLSSSSGIVRLNPALWFLSLNEVLAGGVFADLPRHGYPDAVERLEITATARYEAARPLFHDLSERALVSVTTVFVVALALYLWNSRTLPLGLPLRAKRRSRFGRVSQLMASRLLRKPAARASFFFTIKAMWRSAPHRVSMTTAIGAATAAMAALLGNVPLHGPTDTTSAALSIFAIPVVAIGLVSAGFRYAMRLPADLRAGWIFQLCWSGDERAYLTGVKAAGIASAAIPALVATLWIAGLTLPWRAALAQSAFSLLLAVLLYDLIMFRFASWPFASTYVAQDNVAEVAPMYVLGFILCAFVLSQLQREAFATSLGASMLLGAVLVAVIAVRIIDSRPHPARNVEVWNRSLVDAGRVNLSGVDW